MHFNLKVQFYEMKMDVSTVISGKEASQVSVNYEISVTPQLLSLRLVKTNNQ